MEIARVTRDDVRRRALVRGRTATALYFLFFGAALGCWTSRIPAIKTELGLSDGLLSLALLAFALGAIAGMLGLGRLVDRWGSFRILVPTALLEGLLLVPTAFMPSLGALMAALFVFGLAHGTLNIAMNANAMEVQRAWGSPIVTSFHAVYSIGGFLGAAVGGLFAHQDVSPEVTFLAVGAGVLALAVWAIAWTLRDAAPKADPSEAKPAPRDQRGDPRTLGLLLLGGLAMCTLVGEGTAADWSAVYLHESLGSTPAFAAVAFAAFSVAMTVGRLLGDRLAARFGPVLLVRGCGVLASVGMIAALLIGHPVAAVIGFACLGAGMSCIAPQVYAAAAQRDPARAGAALSLVVSLGYVGFLIGPLVIGAVSTVTGLPTALGIPALLILLVVLGASALRPASEVTEVTEQAVPAQSSRETSGGAAPGGNGR